MNKRRREDEDLLVLVRVIASGTATALVTFTVVVDALGRLFIDPSFHVSEILFGSLVGAWLALIGLEGVSLLRRRQNGDGNGHGGDASK